MVTQHRTESVFQLMLLCLIGISLRMPIIAVVPVLPLVHRDLGLDEKSIAALNGLPIFLFAVAAIPGSLLISRIGARRALLLGLFGIAAASALRGAGSSAPMLFGMTFLMGFCASISQPAVPTLIGQWFPASTSRATAIYANGMVFGGTFAASATISLVLPLVGGSWEWSFVLWSVPVLATVLLVAIFTPHVMIDIHRPRILWWPDWRDARTWRLGLLQGGGSTAFYGGNAFLPDYLHAIGRPELVSPVLTSYNGLQFPASLLILLFASRLSGRRGPFVISGMAGLLGLAAMAAPADWIVIAGAGVAGVSTVVVLILTLALPPLLAEAEEIHRLSAGMLTIGYTLAFTVPLIGGAIWDETQMSAAAFIPGVIGSLVVIVLGVTLPPGDRGRSRTR